MSKTREKWQKDLDIAIFSVVSQPHKSLWSRAEKSEQKIKKVLLKKKKFDDPTVSLPILPAVNEENTPFLEKDEKDLRAQASVKLNVSAK